MNEKNRSASIISLWISIGVAEKEMGESLTLLGRAGCGGMEFILSCHQAETEWP